jgi:Protein of unknown function (DUF1553)/Protein of unknown function (DUF1549)
VVVLSGCTGSIDSPTRDEAPTNGDAPPASHWSLRAPERPPVPATSREGWSDNPIDAFVLAKLTAAGLEPSPRAEAHVQLRRLTLDLTGLPPIPEEVARFEADPSEAAYSAHVERLLSGAEYGEQRAHYWLDVARFADTHGYHFDNYRSIWPYRDYVIDAFATGERFDQFTIEQLAGDLLPNPTARQRTATGFIRSAMSTNEAGVDEAEYASLYAKDRVETLGVAWLGLTLGCAACHDHRYDPITQRDFYALAAFFRNTTEPVLDGNLESSPPSLGLADGVSTLVTDEMPGPPRAHVLVRGRFDAPGEEVPAGVPASLPPLPPGEPANRLALARWLVAPEHPLTARVIVNRFWAELFGVGLVRTPHDLGRAGELPSHPELLDWLAVEFRESGWDVKHLFRLMVTSSTYRQACVSTPANAERDSDNRLLSRGPRFRMDGEVLRDLALAVSGLLARRVGGPSVKPYQPPQVWEAVSLPQSNTFTYEQQSGDALYRRSLYTFWKRQAPPPALEILGAPTREQAVAQRERANTPLQAFVTLNDPQFVEAARVLATHALGAADEVPARADYLSTRVLSRRLRPEELGVFERLLDVGLATYGADLAAAADLIHVGESQPPSDVRPAELAAWTLVANAMLNLDEAVNK